MSPSTIGGIIGAGIGFVVGGPAGARWGWMLGGMAGSIISPERYEGPRLDEARVQTSQDGVPLIYGYGTFPCMGNLAWIDEVKEHRHKRKAKGTPEQVDYTYTRSYMIVVCKGEISGYKIIKRNGKIVYDARTDAELSALGYSSQEIKETRAAQAKFLQTATLYYGTDTQMPDPTMVAVKGAGNVPAYTGIAYIVLKDDETREGETAQFEFVVAACGTRTDDFSNNAKLLVTGNAVEAGAPMFAIADATPVPTFVGLAQDTGADLPATIAAEFGNVWVAAGAGSNNFRYSIDGMATWQSGALSIAGVSHIAGGHDGFIACQDLSYGSIKAPLIPSSGFSEYIFPVNGQGPNGRIHGSAVYTGQHYYTAGVYTSEALCSVGNLTSNWDVVINRNSVDDEISKVLDLRDVNGDLYLIHYVFIYDNSWSLSRIDKEGGRTLILNFADLDDEYKPFQIENIDETIVVLTQGADFFWTNVDGFLEPHSTGLGSSSVSGNIGRRIAAINGRFYVISTTHFVVINLNDGDIDVSDPVALPIVDARSIVAGGVDHTPQWRPIPDAPGWYINMVTGAMVGPAGTTIDHCQPTLASIVADQCSRRGIGAIDVSELTDEVDGYRVAAPSTSQRNIQGLQPGYFFSASEFDGLLHFPKRGRSLTFALTHDDFVDRDGDPIQWERTQEPELPRKVTVAYIDPATSYTATTQQAERRSATVKAEGETTVELAITGQKNWAAQVSDKAIKVSWGENEECTFHVTIEHANLVTGAEGTVPYLDGSTTTVRIDRIEDEGLVRRVTARRTRRNLYESNASGAAKPLPRFPGSSIRGPTDGLLLNIPVLIDSDDRPGIHWAASGQMSGWAGTQLQILRAGQWTLVGETSSSAAMGALLAPLPYHSGDIDTANVLRIQINDEMESVTFANLLQERNPLAILRPDGTAEIVQFQTATETAPGEYTLTNLLRNRVNTGASAHATDARVVFLDDRVQYATLEPTDIGQVITYRFVTLGTDPDAAPILTHTLTTMESQMEWPVYDFQVEQDGDDFHLTWRRRDRLGTDVFPIRSANWVGYTVGWQYSGMVHQEDVANENITFTLPGASNITFNVSQINQFTGNGPATTVHIP